MSNQEEDTPPLIKFIGSLLGLGVCVLIIFGRPSGGLAFFSVLGFFVFTIMSIIYLLNTLKFDAMNVTGLFLAIILLAIGLGIFFINPAWSFFDGLFKFIGGAITLGGLFVLYEFVTKDLPERNRRIQDEQTKEELEVDRLKESIRKNTKVD